MEFIIKALGLTGKERILDLACGYGRHALSFARKGFSVTGVNITKAYTEDAQNTAQELSLDATFIHADIRDVAFQEEFDVVLNLDDGAIGYLENANPIRLYSFVESENIFHQHGMKAVKSFSNYTEKESSDKELVLNVYSLKQ